MPSQSDPLLPVNTGTANATATGNDVADYVEGFLDYFIDLVCICSQSSVLSSFVAFAAECGFSLANAHAVTQLVHNLENRNDPQGCVEVEKLHHNTLLVWGLFVIANFSEIRKATQILTNFKLKKLPQLNRDVAEQHQRLRQMLSNTLVNGLSVLLGTLTRMGGSTAAFMVGAQTATGAMQEHPGACIKPPAWTIGVGTICGVIIGVYKAMWLSGYAKNEALVNGFGFFYTVLRNASILSDHVTRLVIDALQARTNDESFMQHGRDDLIWLIGIGIVAVIFMVAQKGLNNLSFAKQYDASREGTDPHSVMTQQAQPRWRRIVNKVAAIGGAAGTAGLVASAAQFLADRRPVQKYSTSPEYKSDVYWSVTILLGIFVFIYYTQRFLLGLSFDKR